MSGSVVIAGCMAQKPRQAGHTWQYLQYLLGFRRLGWDVLFLDHLSGPVAADDHRVRYVSEVFRYAGLDAAWTIGLDDGSHIGVGRADTLDHVRSADLLLNVMGYCDDEELLAASRRRVFLDTDPGFGQMWRELGQADIFAGHDVHVTIGERIGAADCRIPDCGLEWITTPQPVVLDAWPVTPPPAGRARFTSIASWRGAYGPIEYRGHRYGLRVHQMRRFADLPTLAPAAFELALHIDENERDDIGLLSDRGWLLTDPSLAAATPTSYRHYLQGSSAELMVAKGMYVDSRSGWFSERSICYLACGRPVLAQDTGLAELYPTDSGLVTFSTLDEAVAGVESIVGDYDRHSLDARAIAEAYFDSDKVLTRLVERVGAAVTA
jgi:hypothetical protein